MPKSGQVVRMDERDRTARQTAGSDTACVIGRIVPASPERQVMAMTGSEPKRLPAPRTSLPPDLGALLGS